MINIFIIQLSNSLTLYSADDLSEKLYPEYGTAYVYNELQCAPIGIPLGYKVVFDFQGNYYGVRYYNTLWKARRAARLFCVLSKC